MVIRLRTFGALLLLVVVAVSAAVVVAASAWERASVRLLERLAGAPAPALAAFDAASLDDLPPPVARYFRRVLRDGQRPVAAATLRQRADFRMSESRDEWAPLEATQTFRVRPPGFVWDARIRMAPGLSVRVRDSYVDGRGRMHASVMGLYPLVSAAGEAALDAGALQRYLAELVWVPTGLLPDAGVSWEPLGDRAALATLADGETVVSLEFHFDETGLVHEVYAPARFREVNGRYVPTPWRVRCNEYATFDGLMIPLHCEVQWELPGGPLPYWRGRIVQARYELAR